jgi:hypothetical protein
MKKVTLILALFLSAASPLALLAHDHVATTDKSPAPDAAWLEKAKADYPLKTCVVSDEQIGGSMGEGIDHVYKQDGKPDRLVRFCCKDCRKDFDKDPTKYLKLLDETAAKANKN